MDKKQRLRYVEILRTAAKIYTAPGDKDYYTNLADSLERGKDILNEQEVITHAQLTVFGYVEKDNGDRP